MTDEPDDAGLVERLLLTKLSRTDYGGVQAGAVHEMLVNPDGPAAVARLTALKQEVERLTRERDNAREALKPFAAIADDIERVSKSQGWSCQSIRRAAPYKDCYIARAALDQPNGDV